jgi:arylesterase / paraoxonase
MMKRKKMMWIIGGAVLAVIVAFVLKTFYDAGEFKTIVRHTSGPCQTVGGVLSSEDITIHPQTGMAFISSDDRRPWFQGGKGQQGAILGYDLTASSPVLVDLTVDFQKEFHPHGIGLFVDKAGATSLFVVNHNQKGHVVEIFDLEQGKLMHRKSIQDRLMISPNDVIPVGRETFYVTNDHGSGSRWGRMLEDYLQLARSNVLYYDGKTFRKVAGDLAYANGINKSTDGKIIYVAATVGKTVVVYDRDEATGNLSFRSEIPLGTGPDNIETAGDGSLWIGAHPKLLTFVKYAKDPNRLSPSQVLRVNPDEGPPTQLTEIYLTDGRPLSGSSVAAVFEDKLLIGSVFDDRFLVCSR